MSHRPSGRRLIRVFGVALFATACVVSIAAQAPPAQPAKQVAPVAVAGLRALLPTMDGWTRASGNGDRIALSDTCAYAYADAIYTNGNMEVRVTVADTTGAEDSLISLATMIVTFPAGYSEEIQPATTIKRTDFNGSPAAQRWDGSKGEGEFTVLVDGRFVAKAEGKHVNSIDTLRALVARIDLKALAALK